MNEPDNFKNVKDFDDSIDIQEFFYVLSGERRIIISVTAIVSIISIIFSLLLPNIYESETVLVPVNPSSSISGALKSYSGLAGLAGINLPTDDIDNNSAKALKKLRSLSFFENNILNNIYLPDLMAVKSWDHETSILSYDPRIYDINSNTWVRDYSYPQKLIPSAQESFEVFIEDHFSLSEDKETGFITLSVKHQSPVIAQRWAELAVDEVNNFYRQKDKSQSQKAVKYLNEQILMTGLSEIKQVIAQLLQEETQKLALVEANEFYVFDYIDPPAVMEEKYGPSRVLILILGLLLGTMLGIFMALIKHYFLRNNIKKL